MVVKTTIQIGSHDLQWTTAQKHNQTQSD